MFAVFSAKTTEIVGVALSRGGENEAVATLALRFVFALVLALVLFNLLVTPTI